MHREAIITVEAADLRIAVRDGVLTLHTSRNGVHIAMVDADAADVTPCEFIEAWAQQMRDMLAIVEWGSRTALAGRWTLAAEMFPGSCIWAAHWTDRPRCDVAVLFDACPARTKLRHGERTQTDAEVVKRARVWVEAALRAWINDAEAGLQQAVAEWA